MRLYQFNKLVGNSHCVNMLKRGITQHTLPHFMIFHGIMGTGKSSCAEITALALTCENPQNGEPCLQCNSCRENLEAIQNNLKSANVSKINLGRFNTKADVEEMIKDIFILESSKNCVYILEEAHSLTPYLQTALLEEVDKMDNKTYVILCTTKINEIIPELKSRSILFPFKRLREKESRLLLDMFLKEKCVNMDDATKTLIIGNTNGIPREIMNLTEFIIDNRPTLSELKNFLSKIDDSVFYTMFQTLRYGTMHDLIQYIREEVDVYEIGEFVSNLKAFYLKLFFFVEGNIDNLDGDVDNFDLASTVNALKGINLFTLGKMINSLNHRFRKEDLHFFFLSLYQFFHDKKISTIVKERKNTNAQKSESYVRVHDKQEGDTTLGTLHAFVSNGGKKYDFGGDLNQS